MTSKKSMLLFARPSFLEGLARVLDIGGTLQEYNRSPTPVDADDRAIRSDVAAVGNDLRSAIKKYQREYEALLNNGKKAA